MASYVQPTMSQIEELVADFKRLPDRASLNPTQEKHYDWVIPQQQGPKLAVRWYTTVSEQQGAGKGCGKDAFRVCIVRSPGSKAERVIYSLTRVHRTPGWQDRVRQRLILAWRLATRGPTCPACGARMVPRVAKQTRLFWSCTRYPECRGSRRGINSTDASKLLEGGRDA